MITKKVYVLKRIEKIDRTIIPEVLLGVYLEENEAKDALKMESRRWDHFNWDRHCGQKSIVYTWIHDGKTDMCLFMITEAILVGS